MLIRRVGALGGRGPGVVLACGGGGGDMPVTVVGLGCEGGPRGGAAPGPAGGGAVIAAEAAAGGGGRARGLSIGKLDLDVAAGGGTALFCRSLSPSDAIRSKSNLDVTAASELSSARRARRSVNDDSLGCFIPTTIRSNT